MPGVALKTPQLLLSGSLMSEVRLMSLVGSYLIETFNGYIIDCGILLCHILTYFNISSELID